LREFIVFQPPGYVTSTVNDKSLVELFLTLKVLEIISPSTNSAEEESNFASMFLLALFLVERVKVLST